MTPCVLQNFCIQSFVSLGDPAGRTIGEKYLSDCRLKRNFQRYTRRTFS